MTTRVRAIAVCLFLTILSWMAQAHEFWMQPSAYRIRKGETVGISFRVGEEFSGEPWKFTRAKIDKLAHYQASLPAKDLKGSVIEGGQENLGVRLDREGTHLFILESQPSYIKMNGADFNEYLAGDGLDEALSFRRKNNLLNDSASELYSRHSKLLVQAGNITDETYRREIGLPVEIVPVENPYTRRVGDRLHFRILYRGKPLFGALVKIFNRHDNRTTIQKIYSQQDGTIEMTVSAGGNWLVSFVKMVPSEDDRAGWRSYWASLTFGI